MAILHIIIHSLFECVCFPQLSNSLFLNVLACSFIFTPVPLSPNFEHRVDFLLSVDLNKQKLPSVNRNFPRKNKAIYIKLISYMINYRHLFYLYVVLLKEIDSVSTGKINHHVKNA